MKKNLKLVWRMLTGVVIGAALGGIVLGVITAFRVFGETAALFVFPALIGAFIGFARHTIKDWGWQW